MSADAPVTRPDLDAIGRDARGLVYVSDGTRGSDRVMRLLASIGPLLAALAAEQARADQAEQRIANAKMLIRTWNINGATLSNLFEVLSAAPTAEPSDQ